MKLAKLQKKQRYYHVVDNQGEVVSYHRTRQGAEKAILGHVAFDREMDQGEHDYRIYAPEVIND